MPKLINLKKKSFGEWTVENKPHILIKNHTSWWCKCSCGKRKIVGAEALMHRRSRSCGCKKINLRFKTLNIDQRHSTVKRCFEAYKRGAIVRKHEFKLTIEEFETLTQGNCHYCGEKPQQVYKRKYVDGISFIYNGIDRIDNNYGYMKKNCVSCCYKCNRAKANMTQKEFFELIKKITNHQKLENISATKIRAQMNNKDV